MSQMANELGVSRNAVSAVVNGRSRKLGLAKATEEKIKAYLEQSGYVQSKSAIQLRGGAAADVTGILTCGPIALYPHLVKALHLLSESIKRNNGHVEIIGIDPDNIRHGLREVVSQGIGNLIWIHANAPEFEIVNARKLLPLLNRMKRVVIYNYDYSRDEWEQDYFKHGIQLVGVDRLACYDRVAEMFSQAGHTQIALDEVFVDHPARMGPNAAPLLKAFAKKGFAIHGLREADEVKDISPAAMTERLLKLHDIHQVNCAFIRNDLRAVEIMGRLKEAGLRVPEEMAIIGFGNNPMTRWTTPPLTTFDFPVERMCEETIRLIEAESVDEARRSYFDNDLILRNSHAVS
jgi:DNA-binding LacI/PurR family transcriptional regulator